MARNILSAPAFYFCDRDAMDEACSMEGLAGGVNTHLVAQYIQTTGPGMS
jgi:hypothetical protein